MVVGALAKRHPAACDKAILTPLIAPLVLATDGTMVTDLTAVQKLYKLLSSLPPPPAKLCNLLLAGGALVPLLNVAAYAHWLHTREGSEGVGGSSSEAPPPSPELVKLSEQCLDALMTLSNDGLVRLEALFSDPEIELEDLDRLVVFVTKRLGRRSASMKLLVAALTTRMLSSALGVLSSGSDEEPAEGATAEEVKAVASSGGVVVSATLLLDGATTEDLTAYLSTDPKPALDLLKAALPAADETRGLFDT